MCLSTVYNQFVGKVSSKNISVIGSDSQHSSQHTDSPSERLSSWEASTFGFNIHRGCDLHVDCIPIPAVLRTVDPKDFCLGESSENTVILLES